MNRHLRKVALVLFTALVAAPTGAAGTDSILTIDRIFHDKEFELNTKVPSKWLEGGDSYTTVEASQTVYGGFDIVRHDSASGKKSIQVLSLIKIIRCRRSA
mgnify:CR=1 FL=1